MIKEFIAILIINILIVISIGNPIIKFLKKLKAGQVVREEGPQNHKAKEGTPTMGGLIFLIPILLITLIFSYNYKEGWLIILTVISFILLGLIDDLLIIKQHKNDGIRPKLKLIYQIIIGITFGICILLFGHEPIITIPFTSIFISFDSLEWLYVLFIALIITSSTNALNITDGLDGLLAGLTCIALIAPLWIILSTFDINNPLIHTVAILGFSTLGGALGFLWFNSNPASVFMGNTGSMGLGAIIAIIAILLHLELWLIIFGFVFVLETLSVILQVTYFKLTKGKRIFKMSPIHHHFELSGWKESKIVNRFYIIGIICTLITILGY